MHLLTFPVPMSENERLKEVRKILGLTQRQISEYLEIKQGSYSDVERGKAGISAVLLKNLIRRFRVNPLWLCEGEGNMFLDSNNLGTKPDKPEDIAEIGKRNNANYEISSNGSIGEHISLLEQQNDYLENLKSVIEFLQNNEQQK